MNNKNIRIDELFVRTNTNKVDEFFKELDALLEKYAPSDWGYNHETEDDQ